MGQFSFYCARHDYASILDSVLRKHGVRYVVNEKYTYPLGDTDDDVSEDAMDRIMRQRTVYLVGAFTVAGVPFRRLAYGSDAGLYRIDEMNMGPVLGLSFPTWFREGDAGPAVGLSSSTWFREGGMHRVASGELHYCATYYDTESETWCKATDELRTTYGTIITTLKKHLRKANLLSSSSWLSPLTLSLMAERKIAICDAGRWITGPLDDLTVTGGMSKGEESNSGIE